MASRELYMAQYGRRWEWTVNFVRNVEGERHRSGEHNGSPKGRAARDGGCGFFGRAGSVYEVWFDRLAQR